MSMQQRVGRQEIEYFLLQVGRTRQPGRLYLTGERPWFIEGLVQDKRRTSIFR